MEQILIREPTIADNDILVSLTTQLGYSIDAENMKKNISFFSTLPLHKIWVATQDDIVLGYIAVAITHYFHKQEAFLRVIAIVVDQYHRKKGIGKKLMQMAENYAFKMKCSHIELSSGINRAKIGSHDFYHSIGYVELNELKKYFGKKLSGKAKL